MYFKTSFLHCCRHIISVFLGVAETIVGSFVVQFWTKQSINSYCQPYVRKPGKDQACSSHHPETLPNSRGTTGLKTRSAITSCCWNEFDLSQMNTCIGIKRERKQRRRGRQRKRPIKSNRFRLTKQQLCTCITLFCTFVYFFAATARFVWDVNTRQGFPFSFPELRWILLGFNSRKNCQNWTNWTRWDKPDKV